jgi:glycosyltransferase involved in cell wall biosynthesis
MARILVIRQYRFPNDIRVRREVQALLDDGHRVDVIGLAADGEPLRETWQGVRIHRLRMGTRRSSAPRYLFEYGAFALFAAVLAAALHLRRRYDLVQVHSLPDPLVFAALVPKLLGAKVQLDLMETMPEFFATRFPQAGRRANRIVEAAEQASIRFADHVITCTEQMKEAFVGRGAPPAKIDVILNSADESIFDAERHPPRERTPGRFELIVHGTIEERYGIDTAIEAVALLAGEIPELELQVFGKGSYREELERLAAERGVADRVHIRRDFVPLDDLVHAVSQADAGVVAMKRDPFRDLTHCNKMYELITMRRPQLMSRTRSVEAYFDDDCFAWFESNDPADLARAIRRLHADPALADELVANAAARNAPYRWEHQRDHYQQVVRRVLARG